MKICHFHQCLHLEVYHITATIWWIPRISENQLCRVINIQGQTTTILRCWLVVTQVAPQLLGTTATSAPVRDEAIEAVLGMNQKHILFPCPGIFQPSSLPQNLPLIPLSYPPPTSLTSFPTHSIAKLGRAPGFE
jgi:hypothetical protein